MKTEMKMPVTGVTRVAHGPQRSPTRNRFADIHTHLRQVRVQGEESILVIEPNRIAPPVAREKGIVSIAKHILNLSELSLRQAA